MKGILITIFLIFSSVAFANGLKVEINPKRPVAGEVFQAYFKISTDFDEEPSINFNPLNIEVVGKSNQGVSTRTIYANGKLTVSREISVAYDLVASKPGPAYLRDISVELGKKRIHHSTIALTVVKEPEEVADVFVMADVPKTTLFLGEGIVVRYFLYSRVPVSNLDIKRYPKLNKFLKRFLQEPERTERVTVDGQIFMRTQIYAAKLYPEKVGELKVDSMRLSASYPSTRPGDPFGAFGLSRDFKTKTVQSETIKIQVRALPQPIPPHFTGLVGTHDIKLQLGQSKLIVNQPLEVKLVISGVGALENLEAPVLIKDPGLEEFETNGDLKISNADHATKTFDYTFLAKKNMKLPAKEMTLSYFDPNTERYIPTQINIPAIEVAGGQLVQNSKLEEDEKSTDETAKSPPTKETEKTFSSPVTVDQWQWKQWLPIINTSLALLAIVISLGWVLKEKKIFHLKSKNEIPSSFKKGNFQLSEFLQWMTPLIKETAKSPSVIIKDSKLSEDSKRYFIDLLNANDYKDYSSRKSQMEFKYQAAHFKELSRYIERVRNENSSQPS
jgi:hypothetical protein